MSGTPPQIQMTQSGQGSLVAIITGAAAILITQLGTSFSSQAGVSAVKENQLILLQEVKEVSNANRALNEKIVRLSEENQRLSQLPPAEAGGLQGLNPLHLGDVD